MDVVGTAFLSRNDAKDGGSAPGSGARYRHVEEVSRLLGEERNISVAGGASGKRALPDAGSSTVAIPKIIGQRDESPPSSFSKGDRGEHRDGLKT